jgi:uncharacterized protein
MTQAPPPPPPPPAAQTPPPAPAPGAAPPSSPLSQDERTWGMLCHLLGLVGFLGPLIIWLIKKEQYRFVDQQGKESLNWQLTVLIGWVICVPLYLIVIGALAGMALGIANLVFLIMGAVKANDGIAYKYPWRIQFFK